MPTLPVPPSIPTPPSAYASFVDFIAGHVQKGTSGVTQEWVGQALASMGVEGGLIANLANAPADKIAEYRTSIAEALGVPAI
jgi:NADPH:quinone reductase-like Zn-dependent oxidoreductase